MTLSVKMKREVCVMLGKYRTVEELVPDGDMHVVFANTNFGIPSRDILRFGALKCNVGLYQGHTSRQVCTELGLIDANYQITAKGLAYIWLTFGRKNPV